MMARFGRRAGTLYMRRRTPIGSVLLGPDAMGSRRLFVALTMLMEWLEFRIGTMIFASKRSDTPDGRLDYTIGLPEPS